MKEIDMIPEELMIGDLVIHGFGGIGKITEIDSKTVVIKDDGFDTSDGMNEVSFALNELTPIPLTAEILEKNGFKRELSEDNIHYRFILIYSGIRFSLFYVRSVFQWLGPLDFKYVHELQHALRLCGIDKEIGL